MSEIKRSKGKTWSRTVRPPTPEERVRYEKAIQEVEAEEEEILADARRSFEEDQRIITKYLSATGALDLPSSIAALKAAREAQGMTLADVSAATGMSVPALSNLETGRNDNPTLRTLQRYAKAVGRRFVVGLIEDRGGDAKPAATSQSPSTRSRKIKP